MDEVLVNKQSFKDWSENAVTRGISSLYKNRLESLADVILSGAYLGDQVKQARLIGEYAALKSFLSIEYRDIETGEKSE